MLVIRSPYNMFNFDERLVLQKRLHLSQNKLITCHQRTIRRVLRIPYLDYPQLYRCLCRKHTYHRHKDKSHYNKIIIAGGH